MENIVYNIEKIVCGIPLVVFLMGTHIYLTFKLKFPQKYTFKGLKYMLKSDKENTKEGISSFKSLMAVLASTLGTGNIIGVATAIIIGGVGSIFWIFVSGIFAIATKYAETYLALKYRKEKSKGFVGGAMYVLKYRLKSNGLAIVFCIFLICSTFGMGAMIQSNSISSCISQNYNINISVIAILIVVICAYVLYGNERRISNISSVLIPIATITYLISCILLIYIYRSNIIPSVRLIISEAFNFRSCVGGILSCVAIKAMSTGLSKGLFTNEAGMGTSPIFDCTVRETNIKKQSIISSTSVFIDTVVLCTLTGVIFVATGMYNITDNPSILAQSVFELLPYGKIVYILLIFIFAIATIPCAGYYGSIATSFMFKSKKMEGIYRILFLICVYIGAISKIKFVWSISSLANALMVIPNIFMIYKLKNEIEK